jgi:deazaflavin-dependent oxidoreductase (nitroreductase family)
MADHMRRSTVAFLSRLHAVVYRATGGLIGRRLVRNDMLLLTTTGRRSGRRHTVPLLYLTEDTSLLVVASYGGRHHDPDWLHNLRADPHAAVQVGRRRLPVVGRVARPDEHRRLWPRVVHAYDGYAVYQSRTDRVIPIVLLEPARPTRNG